MVIEIIGFDKISDTMMKLGRLNGTIPRHGRMTTTVLARKLTRNLRMRVPVWMGTLKKSIKSRAIDENTIGVTMLDYWREVEFGHGPVEANEKIWAWAVTKIKSPSRIGKAILTLKTVGARPHPFVQPALASLIPETMPTFSSQIRTAIRNSGFRGR